jgi:pyocin large subunit-like protein
MVHYRAANAASATHPASGHAAPHPPSAATPSRAVRRAAVAKQRRVSGDSAPHACRLGTSFSVVFMSAFIPSQDACYAQGAGCGGSGQIE